MSLFDTGFLHGEVASTGSDSSLHCQLHEFLFTRMENIPNMSSQWLHYLLNAERLASQCVAYVALATLAKREAKSSRSLLQRHWLWQKQVLTRQLLFARNAHWAHPLANEHWKNRKWCYLASLQCTHENGMPYKAKRHRDSVNHEVLVRTILPQNCSLYPPSSHLGTSRHIAWRPPLPRAWP